LRTAYERRRAAVASRGVAHHDRPRQDEPAARAAELEAEAARIRDERAARRDRATARYRAQAVKEFDKVRAKIRAAVAAVAGPRAAVTVTAPPGEGGEAPHLAADRDGVTAAGRLSVAVRARVPVPPTRRDRADAARLARIEAELAAVRPLTVRCGVDLNHLFRVAAARLPDEASPLLDRLAVLIGAALRDELRAPGTGKK
jgi:hypothetical protein